MNHHHRQVIHQEESHDNHLHEHNKTKQKDERPAMASNNRDQLEMNNYQNFSEDQYGGHQNRVKMNDPIGENLNNSAIIHNSNYFGSGSADDKDDKNNAESLQDIIEQNPESNEFKMLANFHDDTY